MHRNELELNSSIGSDIIYIFRRPQATYFSLERVFKQLAKEFAKNFNVELYNVPRARPLPFNILVNCLAVRRLRTKIYHVTGDVHYVTLTLPGKRTILTVHDLAVMYRKKGFRRILFKYLFLQLPVKHCKYITCISEKTKSDIVKFTGCQPDRIHVIPNPVDDFFKASPKKFNAERPILLFVGTAPHKNLARTIEAINGIPCLLDVIGRIPENEKMRLNELKIDFRESFDLSNEELALRYKECDLVLFPSLFEGFGLPILEAQQTERPVITSWRSPMKEVAGNGACFIDPEDIGSIREGLLQVINDPTYRAEICLAANENIKKYSVDSIASKYEDLYQSILEF